LSCGLSSCSFLILPSGAFENKISDKYDDLPKRRGPQVSEGMLLSSVIFFTYSHTVADVVAKRLGCCNAKGYDWRRIHWPQTLWTSAKLFLFDGRY
jgi:hypothetical protein